ncbi:MAG: hypothetical protein L3J65_01815 [Robiginitomaculum sp.]|nr:hypothetical protein [Robiginitomaculum sp.]
MNAMQKLILGLTAASICAIVPLTASAQQPKPTYSAQTDPWLQGTKGMQYMVDQASINAKNQSVVDKFVANKLHVEWNLSNSHNAYKPFRKVLADKYTAAKALNVQDHAKFNGILFRASKLIDDHYKDKMPDFLYEWLEASPKPPKQDWLVGHWGEAKEDGKGGYIDSTNMFGHGCAEHNGRGFATISYVGDELVLDIIGSTPASVMFDRFDKSTAEYTIPKANVAHIYPAKWGKDWLELELKKPGILSAVIHFGDGKNDKFILRQCD